MLSKTWQATDLSKSGCILPQRINSTRREHGQKRKASRRPDKNAGSVFEQREALARLRAHLRDEVRTKNAGSVFEQRKALAQLWAHLRDEVRTKNAGSVFEQRNALARDGLSDFPI
ncbi:hypothetical protein CBI57_08935 [Pantoea agglomerans]|nr:hypothetical protein CBI57_08935 [Pantoea agglomerans]